MLRSTICPCSQIICSAKSFGILISTFKDFTSILTVHSNFPNSFFLLRWLQEHARNFSDVEITNETDDYATLSINGPKSRALLQELTDSDVSENGFKFMENKHMKVAGIDVLALCVSYTGKIKEIISAK